MKKTKSGYKTIQWLFGKEIEIPEEWNIKKLSNLSEKIKDIVAGPFGSNLTVSDYRNEGVPIIRLQNIERNRFINKNIKFVDIKKAEELIYHSYMPNDLVLAKLGDPIGKTCKIPESFPEGIVVADVVRIRISPKKSNQNFLEYVLNSNICKKQHIMETIGTTRPRVNLGQIRNLQFPTPPISEQQKIASILSGVDALIESTQHIIEKTERLKKGLMQNLLTRGIGHTKFKKTTLGGIAKFSSGEFLPAKNHNSGNVPIYGGNGITGYHDKELIKYNAIIFGRVGAYCGSVHLSNSKSWITDNAIFIKNLSNQITIAYLYRFLSRLNIRLLAEISAQPKISQDILNHIKIHFPEDLKEQQKIASILSGVDAVRYHNIIALIILRIKLAIFLILFVWIGVVQISVFQAYAMSLYLHLVAFDVLHVTEFSCDRI